MIQLARRRRDRLAGFGRAAPAVDAVAATLFAVTWVSPNLIWEGMFELLATYLGAELLILLALFTLSKGHLAGTREELHFDWVMVRCVVLAVAAYAVLDSGGNWYILLFMGVSLAMADFPLRVGAHEHWHEQLDRDVWILMGIFTASLILAGIFGNRIVAGVRFPSEGVLHDLVVNDLRLIQQALSMGTFYFVSKAVLNGYRHATDRPTGVAST